jgi:phospholipid/cholesterol/gamma-HCH transport system ATP-binding protein
MGTYLNKHFGVVGGFSARQSKNQFSTFLPFSNLNEAERILKAFASDLQERGLRTIQAEAHISQDLCFPFAILSGLAESKAGSEEIDLVFRKAEANQKEIAKVYCEIRR